MIPVYFKESNIRFGPPPNLSESQCGTIDAYSGTVKGGIFDGAAIIITAWKPTDLDLLRMNAGLPIFLTCLGGLPPHFIASDFDAASHPV